MERKYMIIIGIIVAVIAIVAFAFVSGMFNQTQTTKFDTEFMSGAFVGNVSKNTSSENSTVLFVDNNNKISYNLSTIDNSSALMVIYKYQGVRGPDYRTYNGNNWSIYFAQAMPVIQNQTNGTNQTSNQPLGIVICECQKESQGYVVYVVFEDSSKVNYTLNTFGDSYVNFVEPLLKSISLKESHDVPAVNEKFGLSKDAFYNQIKMMQQVIKGNYSK